MLDHFTDQVNKKKMRGDIIMTGKRFSKFPLMQFIIFKPLSYCFEEIIGFNVKISFASRPVSRLIR